MHVMMQNMKTTSINTDSLSKAPSFLGSLRCLVLKWKPFSHSNEGDTPVQVKDLPEESGTVLVLKWTTIVFH